MSKPEATSIELENCANDILAQVARSFDEILINESRKHFKDKKLSTSQMSLLMQYPITLLCANRICAAVMLAPEENRSRICMESLSITQQLIERIVNDNFAIMKESVKDVA